MGSGRVPKELHEEHLAETEQALVRLRAKYRVQQHLVTKYGIAPRTARKWIEAVRRRWGAEAEQTDRTAKRNEMRATLNELLHQALNKTIVVKNPDGTVVVDPQSGRPVVKLQPDLQRALHASAQLRALDGLDAPTKHVVEGGVAGVLVVGPTAKTTSEWEESVDGGGAG